MTSDNREPPLLSVVIPARDHVQGLCIALAALADQSLPPKEFEVILVDDGQGSATDVALGFERRLRIRAIPSMHRSGSAAHARNVGIQAATGSVVLLADADVICDHSVLETHLRIHSRTPGLVLLGYVNAQESTPGEWRLRIGADIEEIAAGLSSLHRTFYEESLWPDRRHGLSPRDAEHAVLDHPVPWALGWTTLVSLERSNCAEFDEALLGKGGEDLEWSYRLHKQGSRFAITGPTGTFHHPHPRRRFSDIQQDVVNYYRMLKVHPKLPVELAVAFDCGQVASALETLANDILPKLEHRGSWPPKQLFEMSWFGVGPILVCGLAPEERPPDSFKFDVLLDPWGRSTDMSERTVALLGCALPFANGHFSVALVGERYLALPEPLLCRVFQELLRVSRTVVVAARGGAKPLGSASSIASPYWAKWYYCSNELDDFEAVPGPTAQEWCTWQIRWTSGLCEKMRLLSIDPSALSGRQYDLATGSAARGRGDASASHG